MTTQKTDKKADKAAKRAEALRANLKRRKVGKKSEAAETPSNT